jgi:hypothetical protein
MEKEREKEREKGKRRPRFSIFPHNIPLNPISQSHYAALLLAVRAVRAVRAFELFEAGVVGESASFMQKIKNKGGFFSPHNTTPPHHHTHTRTHSLILSFLLIHSHTFYHTSHTTITSLPLHTFPILRQC